MISHDLIKISVENPIILNLSILVGLSLLIILTSKKKDVISQALSPENTSQLKGLAILFIVVYHLSVHTIKNPDDLLLFRHGDIIGLSIFLILSGYGIATSIENKGLNNFFYKRLSKIYPPFVIAMSLELILNRIFKINESSGLLRTIVSAFGLLPVDRNMWFVNFIILMYCLSWAISKVGMSSNYRLCCILAVSFIFIGNQNIAGVWKQHAFDFPFGYFLALKSNKIMSELSIVLDELSRFCVCFATTVSCSFLFFWLSNTPNISLIILMLVAIATLSYNLMKSKNRNMHLTPNKVSLMFCFVFTYFINFKWSSAPIISSSIFSGFSSLLAGSAAILLIAFFSHRRIHSGFLAFIGGVSYEIYLLHGMFMYSFDFILFRQNIYFTFYLYFAFVVMISCILKIICDKIPSIQSSPVKHS